MHANCKSTPINDNDYSCNITAVDLDLDLDLLLCKTAVWLIQHRGCNCTDPYNTHIHYKMKIVKLFKCSVQLSVMPNHKDFR